MQNLKAKLDFDISNFQANISKIENSLNGLHGAIRKTNEIFRLSKNVIIGMSGAAATAFAALNKAAEMQQLKTSFKVLTGSIQESQQTLAQLTSFAASTPFV